MSEYDRNCIVVCLQKGEKIPTNQTKGADALLTKLTDKGHKNCTSIIMPADPKLDQVKLDMLTHDSRLYILGECAHNLSASASASLIASSASEVRSARCKASAFSARNSGTITVEPVARKLCT